MNNLSKGVLVALGLVTLASCGGGGGDGIAAGGTGGTGISQGPVSGFGSVYINGVKFSTDGATATTVEDSVGTGQTGLKLGMVATVEWERDGTTGKYRAKAIKYSDDVQGPFTVNPNGTLTVLGQTVIVSAQTVFEGDGLTSVTSLATLPAGRVVEVSGLEDNTGAIRASRVELKPVGATYELKGVVSASGSGTFTLGTQVVSFTGTPPANGACVEAKGTTLSGGALVATVVETDDSCALGGTVAANMEVELEGYVSGFVDASNFKVNGQSVQVASTAVYDDKGVPGPITIADGVRVEVEGKMNSSGVLVATKVSLDPELGERPESSIEMEIVMGDAIQATATTLTVYGMTVTVNDSTRFEDGILRDLSDISAHPLEIDAYPSGTSVIATRIRHKSTSTPLLQGPVTASSIVGTSSLVILGVTINTSNTTQYRDINGGTLAASAFFSQAAASGALVKAKGTVNSGIMTASELEIED